MSSSSIAAATPGRQQVWCALALRSAIAFRECALRPQPSADHRRECRSLMREQALRWRQLTPGTTPA